MLYENTGLCRYFSVNFHRDISGYTSLSDFETSSCGRAGFRPGYFPYLSGISPAGAGARCVLDRPGRPGICLHQKSARYGGTQSGRNHRRNARSIITGHFSFRKKESPAGDCFPRDQMLSDIILLLFERLCEKTACGNFDRTADDRIHLTYQAFFDELDALRREHRAQWGKTRRKKSFPPLAQDVLEELSYWGFAFVDQDIITFNPGFSLWQGIYSKKQ